MNQIRDEFQENMEGQELLHTPGGVRDVYGRECARKMHVKKEVHHILKTHGFQDIETPAFEYFDRVRYSQEKCLNSLTVAITHWF